MDLDVRREGLNLLYSQFGAPPDHESPTTIRHFLQAINTGEGPNRIVFLEAGIVTNGTPNAQITDFPMA